MTSNQSPWPTFPVHLGPPYELTVHGPRYIASDYPSVLWPSQVIPHTSYLKTVAERPQESRTFFLNRSVFDLVDAHRYLALTDPKLLGWYLHLSPEDRKIIQDEGGFHQFLLNHPALELSSHHVYVKCWEVFPHVPETFRLLGSMDGRNGFHNQPHDKPANTEQVQRHNIVRMDKDKSSRPVDARSSSHPSAFPVDMNVEGHRRPEFRGQTAMTRGPGAGLPLVEVSPVQLQAAAAAERQPLPVHRAGGDEPPLNSSSIMIDDRSILACVPLEDVKACKSGTEIRPVSTTSEALTAGSESSVFAHTVLRCHSAGVNTSPVPHVDTCDAMTGTELPLCTSASTQTDSPHASDKHVITEVHMADLDYLAEEFMKIKMAAEQMEKVKGLGCKLQEKCECLQRAQQSELQLLALQYSMCHQYCWRIYSCAEGHQLSPLLMMPPAKLASILQKLQSDYNEMREKILAGFPLQQLQPLSVDTEKITRGARCIPAEVISDVLRDAPSGSCPETWRTPGERARSCASQSRASCKQSPRKEQIGNGKARTTVTLIPQDKAAVYHAKEEILTQAACKEFNAGEAWYDAEEDLELTGTAAVNEEDQAESGCETSKSPQRCVSAESDMLLLNKHSACEVGFPVLKNDQRGCTLHGERINRAVDEGQSQSLSVIEDPRKPLSASQAGTQLINESSPSSSLRVKKVVCVSPTAKGTCVPQHYGTMASLDILMAELTQRHPDVGRQQIVDALMQLKAQDRGVLSSLPLCTIRDMTSALLTGPARNTQP